MSMNDMVGDSVASAMAIGLAIGIQRQNNAADRSWEAYAARLENQLAAANTQINTLTRDYNVLVKKYNDRLKR